MNKTVEVIKKVKGTENDFEFYPTSSEIIGMVGRDLRYQASERRVSIMDIGAGNGNFFKVLESMQPKPKDEYDKNVLKFTKYAIEKSPVLIESMEPDIFIVGTDFHEQTLITLSTNES